jgi:hypothetical protein
MVYVEVELVDPIDWVMPLVVVDFSIFVFHGSLSFDDSQSKHQGSRRNG